MADEALTQLFRMKRPQLVAMAAEFVPPVDIGDKWNTRKIALAIRTRQKADAGQKSAVLMPPASSGATEGPAVSDQPAQPVPGFLEDTPADEVDGRGGPRPGAGRPLGMTNEKAAVRNLPVLPNEAIVGLLLAGGKLIAARVGVEQAAFTQEEAEKLALPLTQLLEYYYPGGIPEIGWVWLSAIGAWYMIIDGKVRIIKAARAAAAVPGNVQEKSNAPAA
jgi:hypothetical protein